MQWAYSLSVNSPWLGLTVFTAVAVVAALACYGIMRALVASRLAPDSELLSRDMIARLGALHALILSLMFVQEMADYRSISRVVSQGVSVISDVHNGLVEYGKENPESIKAIDERIFAYVHAVLRQDRTRLAKDPFGGHAWDHYQRTSRALWDLRPMNEKQKELRAEMLADWDLVSELRQQLKAAVGYTVPAVFWLVAVTGFFAVVVPCYVYAPKLVNLATLSVYAAFNGMVMYVMFAIANPFTGIAAIEFTELQKVSAMMENTAAVTDDPGL